MSEHLVIFGASARAAAFSALRAGLKPWCADLFADRDLQARCPVVRVAPDDYPRGFSRLLAEAPPGPWMYTGGLENHPQLIGEMMGQRHPWGTGRVGLERVRSPQFVHDLLRRAGLPCPEVRLEPPAASDRRVWMVKPLAGAGGRGVRRHSRFSRLPWRRCYFQQWVPGESWSAVYLGLGTGSQLIGVTKQLVGETWLGAAPYHYCGSVGPLSVAPDLQSQLAHLGNVLAEGCQLVGLFGVDGIHRDGVFWPVEVNPRYPASFEVLEIGERMSLFWLAPRGIFPPETKEPKVDRPKPGCLGKAILFARRDLVFPADGPWLAVLNWPSSLWEPPPFADIPAPGEHIPAGRPVLTFFARGTSPAECLERLECTAADLDRWLYQP